MSASLPPPFHEELFTFLRQIRQHNERTWFETNKPLYETAVRMPAFAFINAMGPRLATASPHFRAVAKKNGGSLMRIYRDTRFSKDKTPYKTNVGIQFRHELGRDVHAPGYYVHLEPGRCFLGAGIWRPGRSRYGSRCITARPADEGGHDHRTAPCGNRCNFRLQKGDGDGHRRADAAGSTRGACGSRCSRWSRRSCSGTCRRCRRRRRCASGRRRRPIPSACDTPGTGRRPASRGPR